MFMKQSSQDRRYMRVEKKEVTLEELIGLIQSQNGEFIIHVEPWEGEESG